MNDSHDPDGLAEFVTELGADGTRRARTRTPDDDDWLSVFITEPHLDTLPRASRGTLVVIDDDLNQFPPDEHVPRAPDDEDSFLDQFPEQQAVSPQVPAAIVHAQAPRQPWVGPWAAAVLAIAISVLLGTRSLHPAWWNAGLENARPDPATDIQNAAASSPSSGAVASDLQFAAPAVEQGISSRVLRRFETVPVRAPRLAIPIARATPDRTLNPSPRQVAMSAQSFDRAQSKRADRVPAVDILPLAPVVAPSKTTEDFLRVTPSTTLRPDATVASFTAPKPVEAVGQESAVRRTLRSYEQAYEDLDVAATAAVWPSVDRRALARAFDTLKSQGLDFKSCAITVTDASATARCRGTLQIIRKVGNSMPLRAEQEWVFKMRRLGNDWKIDNVAATQAAGLAEARTRTQG